MCGGGGGGLLLVQNSWIKDRLTLSARYIYVAVVSAKLSIYKMLNKE